MQAEIIHTTMNLGLWLQYEIKPMSLTHTAPDSEVKCVQFNARLDTIVILEVDTVCKSCIFSN